MITFPKSEVDRFRHSNKSKRWGQAFFDHMKLHKVSDAQDKAFCDKLYNADEATAKAMVASRLDRNN